MTQDIVFIEGLQVDTVIGVYDWEKKIKQTLEFDIEMRTDIRQAAQIDDLSKTVDYAVVANDIMRLAHENQAELIETVAEMATSHILSHYPVSSVKLTIRKLAAVENARSVGVRIERNRADVKDL